MAVRLENIQQGQPTQPQRLGQPIRLTNIQPQGKEGTELTSGDISPERAATARETRQAVLGQVADKELALSAQSFLNPTQPIGGPQSARLKRMDTFNLLEVINQSKVFRDKRKRNLAFTELKRRGISNDFIQAFTEIDDATGFVANLTGEIPEMAGGMIGAGIGALAGRGDPAAIRKLAIAGAGLGAGATELARELFERKFRPERRRGFGELATDTAFTVATEALGEAGGRFIIDPLVGVLATGGLRRAAIPGAEQVSRELATAGQQVAREGDFPAALGAKLPIQTTRADRALAAVGLGRKVTADLTPAQLSASNAVATLEGISRSAFLGGGRLAKTTDIAQIAATPRFLSNKLNEITGGMDVLPLDKIGVIAHDAIHGSKVSGQTSRGASGAFNAIKRVIFSDVTDRVVDPIDISSAQTVASNILEAASKKGTRLKLPPNTEAILRKVVDTGNVKSMQDLIFARSDVGDLVRSAQLADEPKAQQVLAPVMKELTDLMNTAAREVGPQTAADLRRALLFSAEGKKRFSSNLIRKLVAERTDPEKMVRVIFGAPGDETLVPLTAVRNVKEVLLGTAGKTADEIKNNKFAWDQLRFGWLASRITKASDPETLAFKGRVFTNAIDNFGDTAMKEMFDPKELAGIEQIKLFGTLAGKKTAMVAPLIVKSAQAGSVAGGVAFGKRSLALSLLGGPAVLGRFLTSPLGRKFLTTGGVGGLAGAQGQFISGMSRTKIAMDAKQKRLEKFEADLRQQTRMIRSAEQARLQPGGRELRGFGGRGF